MKVYEIEGFFVKANNQGEALEVLKQTNFAWIAKTVYVDQWKFMNTKYFCRHYMRQVQKYDEVLLIN
jgi:hypothetical protein